jgi:hypothetical protein
MMGRECSPPDDAHGHGRLLAACVRMSLISASREDEASDCGWHADMSVLDEESEALALRDPRQHRHVVPSILEQQRGLAYVSATGKTRRDQ